MHTTDLFNHCLHGVEYFFKVAVDMCQFCSITVSMGWVDYESEVVGDMFRFVQPLSPWGRIFFFKIAVDMCKFCSTTVSMGWVDYESEVVGDMSRFVQALSPWGGPYIQRSR